MCLSYRLTASHRLYNMYSVHKIHRRSCILRQGENIHFHFDGLELKLLYVISWLWVSFRWMPACICWLIYSLSRKFCLFRAIPIQNQSNILGPNSLSEAYPAYTSSLEAVRVYYRYSVWNTAYICTSILYFRRVWQFPSLPTFHWYFNSEVRLNPKKFRMFSSFIYFV